jgi:hypothetical protein
MTLSKCCEQNEGQEWGPLRSLLSGPGAVTSPCVRVHLALSFWDFVFSVLEEGIGIPTFEGAPSFLHTSLLLGMMGL